MNREFKLTTLANARVTTTKKGDFDVTGYAAVFGNVDSWNDVIEPGAFSNTLKDQGPTRVALRGHDVDRIVGVGTFVEDAYGLLGKYRFVKGVKDSEETLALIKAGALSGISIGFFTQSDGYHYAKGIRRLTAIDLFETSFVTMPANDLARVVGDDEKALRTINETLKNLTTRAALDAAFTKINSEIRKGR